MDEDDSGSSKSRKRDACDKCHDMKCRCYKALDSSVCKRCERFGFECNYSESLRPGRPKVSGSARLVQHSRPVDATHRNAPLTRVGHLDLSKMLNPGKVQRPSSLKAGHLPPLTMAST